MIHLNDLKKGSFILHRGEPYEIVELGIVVTGTHSHTKAKATVKGIFSNSTEVLVKSHHETVEELEIRKKKATVISVAPEKLQIMDSVNYATLEADLNPSEKGAYNEGDEITYIEFNGKVKILGKRKA